MDHRKNITPDTLIGGIPPPTYLIGRILSSRKYTWMLRNTEILFCTTPDRPHRKNTTLWASWGYILPMILNIRNSFKHVHQCHHTEHSWSNLHWKKVFGLLIESEVCFFRRNHTRWSEKATMLAYFMLKVNVPLEWPPIGSKTISTMVVIVARKATIPTTVICSCI